MSIPNVSSLYQRNNRGSEGGLEFSRIINQLLISESEKESFQFTNYSDASGDYKGVDGIMQKGLSKIGLQYKFFPTPFSDNHKSSVKDAVKKAIAGFKEMEEWILVVPEDPQLNEMKWIEELSCEVKIPISVWGHTRIINLMLKHKHIGEKYYPELNYSMQKTSNEPTQDDINTYFKKFIDEDIDVSILFLKAQPTLSDCKAVFTKEYYKEVSDIYYLQYRNLFDDAFEGYSLKSKDVFELKSSTYNDIINKTHKLPGGMHMILEKHNVLNSNTKFYAVSFKEKGADYGVSFSVWCFLNGKWVFFPKPFRVIATIENMKSDKDLNWMIKVLKWLRIDKRLKKEYKNKSILAVNHIMYRLLNEQE